MVKQATIMLASFLGGVLTPAAAEPANWTLVKERQSKPRPITALAVGKRQVEMFAVTARARADTPLRKEYLQHSRSFSKVMPGYPQPAFVTVDFRLRF